MGPIAEMVTLATNEFGRDADQFETSLRLQRQPTILTIDYRLAVLASKAERSDRYVMPAFLRVHEDWHFR